MTIERDRGGDPDDAGPPPTDRRRRVSAARHRARAGCGSPRRRPVPASSTRRGGSRTSLAGSAPSSTDVADRARPAAAPGAGERRDRGRPTDRGPFAARRRAGPRRRERPRPRRFGRGPGFRDITITAISGNERDARRPTTAGRRTIAITELGRADQGRPDHRRVRPRGRRPGPLQQTRNDDGTYTVTALAVVVPSVRGTVSDVTSSGFKVTTRDGSVWTITVDGSTTYPVRHRATGTLADVTNGDGRPRPGQRSTGDNAMTALERHGRRATARSARSPPRPPTPSPSSKRDGSSRDRPCRCGHDLPRRRRRERRARRRHGRHGDRRHRSGPL